MVVIRVKCSDYSGKLRLFLSGVNECGWSRESIFVPNKGKARRASVNIVIETTHKNSTNDPISGGDYFFSYHWLSKRKKAVVKQKYS